MKSIQSIYSEPYVFTGKIPDETYPTKIKQNMKLVSLNKKLLAIPFGSYSYRIQKYPGDLDLIEYYEKKTVKEVQIGFVKKITEIVKDVIKSKEKYFTEMKAGEDMRYNFSIGDLTIGKWIPKNFNRIKELFENKLIDKKDFNIFKKCYMNNNEDTYQVAFDLLRKHRVLRWTKEEVVSKKKVLPLGVKITLEDAIIQKSDVKLDIISIINEKFIEITNYFVLGKVNSKGDYTPINLTFNIGDFKIRQHFASIGLTKQIEKLYYADMYYNPFKLCKRIYALARIRGDLKMIHRIYELITGNISLLYQQKSECEGILTVLTTTDKFPDTTIKTNLQFMKVNLSRIIEIGDETAKLLSEKINKMTKKNNRKNYINKLSKFIKRLKKILNYLTITEMNNINMNPPPRDYMPDKISYNTSKIRTPFSEPTSAKQILEKY